MINTELSAYLLVGIPDPVVYPGIASSQELVDSIAAWIEGISEFEKQLNMQLKFGGIVRIAAGLNE